MKEELLKRKIKILQSDLKLKDKLIAQLEYQIKTGQLPPVGEYLSPSVAFEFYQQHYQKLKVIDLEIENLELKEQLSNLTLKTADPVV